MSNEHVTDSPTPPENRSFEHVTERPESLTQPTEELTADEKQWGMFCHLSAAVAGIVLGGMSWVGPLACWLAKKDTSPFIDEHGKESLNFQLNILIYTLILLVAGFPTCGFAWFLLIPLAAYGIVMPILAGLKANEGESYEYPATFRLIK